MIATYHTFLDKRKQLGTGSPSVSDFVTKIEKKIRESPLKSTLHSAGTTIEGPWDDVMKLIGELHEYSHELGFVTRTDKVQTAEDKVNAVLSKLDQ